MLGPKYSRPFSSYGGCIVLSEADHTSVKGLISVKLSISELVYELDLRFCTLTALTQFREPTKSTVDARYFEVEGAL